MPKKVSKNQSLKELASELESWALANSAEKHPYVENLINSLRSGKDLQFWSSYSALNELPEGQNGEQTKISKLIIKLNQFRNVMIFSPIAFTWASISVAATSYAKFTNSQSNINLNFLDFWENGYKVLPSIWKLSNVAIIDFGIIISIIFASIYINVLENRSGEGMEGFGRNFDSERTNLAFKIDQALYKYQKPTTLLVNSTLNQSVHNLNNATKDLVNVTKSLKEINKPNAKYDKILTYLEDIRNNFQKKK